MYHPAFFETLCPALESHLPQFHCRDFIFRIFNNEWPDLELKARVRHIAVVLKNFLPQDFEKAARVLVALSQSLRRDGTAEQGFQLMFLPEYIELYGTDHPETSLSALEEITKLVSAEFAIRAFLLRHYDVTMQKMFDWSRHEHASVRRLASEGCRPRLPWAVRVPRLNRDHSSIIKLLSNLKNDESLYVRKSVANNLNDISKDDPALILKVARQWQGKSPATDWIIKHACRTLLRQGDEHALKLQGFHVSKRARVEGLTIHPKRVKIGGKLNLELLFVNQEKEETFFRIDCCVDYLTSTGKKSRKVFRFREGPFPPHQQIALKKTISFKDLSTRKHHKGLHAVHILANGRKSATAEFILC